MSPVKHSGSERGAVLVHVTLALFALTALATFVVDYGVLLTARRQAQNAADAAALAAATALAYDNASDMSNSGPAKTSASTVLLNHPVWGQAPVVNITNDITFPPCPDDASASCVRVDVYRDAAHGSPLPTFFGGFVGQNQQGVRASAVAKVLAANAANCLRPWAVADKWLESSAGGWSESQTYNPVAGPSGAADSYIPPTPTSAGTGFNAFVDHGRPLRMKVGLSSDPSINGAWSQPLDLTPGVTNDYGGTVRECVLGTWAIGDYVNKQAETYPGMPPGGLPQATQSGVAGLVGMDAGAFWDPAANGGVGGVSNSCVITNSCTWNGRPVSYTASPRVVAVPVFNVDTFVQNRNLPNIQIVNILGFFVEGFDSTSGSVTGRLLTLAGLTVPTGGTYQSQSAFGKMIVLVR